MLLEVVIRENGRNSINVAEQALGKKSESAGSPTQDQPLQPKSPIPAVNSAAISGEKTASSAGEKTEALQKGMQPTPVLAKITNAGDAGGNEKWRRGFTPRFQGGHD